VYLIVFQPFLIFLTGWSVSVLFKTNKYLGLGILILIILVSIPGNWQIVNNNKSQVADILSMKNSLDSKITGPVRIYSDEKSSMVALPLYYLYLKENWYSSEKVEIYNSAHIELGQNFIFLLGRDKGYGNKAKRKFACHFSAIVYAHKIVQALEELNQAYETNKLSIRPEP
jgi:hypothetical protein